MNVAIVGYGSIAVEHARAIAALRGAPGAQDLRLYGVAGRLRESTEAFARDFDLDRATTDLDALLADPLVDVVLVCSPSDLHADQTARALAAGKHVLCEIPLATSLAAADRLIALAAAADRTLMVCHTMRYHPALLAARALVERGELKPHAIVARNLFRRHENVNWKGRRRSWTDNLLWHHGGHTVDAALWLLDGTASDVAAAVAPPGGPLAIPMNVGLTFRTPRDQIATIALSYDSHLAVHDYVLIGEEATLIYADGRLLDPAGALIAAGTMTDAIARQDADFFAAVREGREPAASVRAVLPSLAVLQAAQDTLDARLSESDPSAEG
jgi:2-hydroxy-4-carboxymuconate semialdehyde hemiacetal dehydrogenase